MRELAGHRDAARAGERDLAVAGVTDAGGHCAAGDGRRLPRVAAVAGGRDAPAHVGEQQRAVGERNATDDRGRQSGVDARPAAAGVASYVLTRRKPTAEEIERERRDLLARSGRITDGTIMDTMIMETRNADSKASEPSEPSAQPDGSAAPTPDIIVYNYRIAGVTYECAQDVTTLADHVRDIRRP